MASKIDFSWNNAENSEYYELWEQKPGDADFNLVVDNIVEPLFSLDMTGFIEGDYQYQVRGVNQFGEGPFSDPVTVNFILPVQVTGLAYLIG